MRKKPTIRVPLLAAALLLAGLGALATSITASADPTCTTSSVLAGSNFEIDTNGNLKVDGAAPCIDWLAGTGTAMRDGVLSKADVPSGSNDDAFGKGTSEDDANPTIVDGSIPPQKSDLKNFGVFTETTSTGKYLALFWTRVQNPNGTTNMDFELNQKLCDPTKTPSNCANNSITPPETPARTVGDKLVTYDLAKGGTVPVISIRSWTGSAWGAANVISASATNPNPTAVGAVNTSAIAATDSGGLGALGPFTFGEAILKFDSLFPANTQCGTFGSAYLKSRSSDSFSAEMKDFISPEPVHITNCADMSTTATANATIGDSISDTATLTNVTATAGGKIVFKAWSTSDCSTDASNPVFTSADIPVNGPNNYNSGTFTPAAVGTYKWTAVYSGDLNNSGVTSPCDSANEVSVVSKRHPAIVTTATGTVIEGTIADSATLSGGTSDISGTITFTLYSDASCTTAVTTGLTPVTVNGNNTYGSGTFTPSAVGTFYWIASYSGDLKNAAVAGSCGDSGESSAVTQKQPSIVTSSPTPTVTIGSAISDSATLSGGTTDVSGSITFTLYSDAACTNVVTTGLSAVTVNGNGIYSSGNFTPASVGTYYWIASYGGDTKNKTASGACGDANESSAVQKAPATIATAQKFYPQDSATVSAGAGGTPTGTVRFLLFLTSDCSDPAVYDQTVTLSSGMAATSNTTYAVTASPTTTYRWKVIYSGDPTHLDATKACGAEQFTASVTDG